LPEPAHQRTSGLIRMDIIEFPNVIADSI
jgi:hypothetical protein